MFYIPSIENLIGMSPHESSLLMSAIGVPNVIGRLTVGFVVDKKVASSLVIFALGCLGCAICCVLYPFTQSGKSKISHQSFERNLLYNWVLWLTKKLPEHSSFSPWAVGCAICCVLYPFKQNSNSTSIKNSQTQKGNIH